jgi:hypothetical protein
MTMFWPSPRPAEDEVGAEEEKQELEARDRVEREASTPHAAIARFQFLLFFFGADLILGGPRSGHNSRLANWASDTGISVLPVSEAQLASLLLCPLLGPPRMRSAPKKKSKNFLLRRRPHPRRAEERA